MVITYKFRIKDAHSRKRLNGHARSVNLVWNYLCEIQRKTESNWRAGRAKAHWQTHFDLSRLTAGVGAELGIGSYAVAEVCKYFAIARNNRRRAPGFRSIRSLGWIPFRRDIKITDGVILWYGKQKFRCWQTREVIGEIKTGAFAQDARGRWYLTVQCEAPDRERANPSQIGIDLGLKTLAVCSNGEMVPAVQHYRKYQTALSAAQRAGNKRRARAIHAKIANARCDQLHKASAKIARENSLIVVGNVNAAKLKKTRMAKSVSDAGWSMFRNMLRYKASRHGAVFIEANERFTSVTCSECGVLSGPRGQKGLRIRQWECSGCGASHDRDVNAAKNILRVGLERQPPVVGIAA